MMIERVKQSKSLVDVMLIARTCQEHYKNNVDSFILVSSDSDYWGLISSLPEARFLVMIERENCGPDLKNALLNAGIFYCYIDDFYSGNAEDIKLSALFKEIERYIDQTVRLNINEMFSAALKATRIEMSLSEKKQFIARARHRVEAVAGAFLEPLDGGRGAGRSHQMAPVRCSSHASAGASAGAANSGARRARTVAW